jgi:hypothetical protein
MAHDVFISYTDRDNLAATTVSETLESEGVFCWIAPRDVQPGAKWDQAIMDAIRASRVMVLVFSEHANRSDHVEREVGSAFQNGITVIPFRLSNTKPAGVLEYYLRPVQWIDAFTQPFEKHLKSLAVGVKTILSQSESRVTDSGAMTVFRDKDQKLIISLQGIELMGLGNLTARINLGVTKGLLGPSTNPSDQRGFHNEENTLFGINHQPCTKASHVHFFVFRGENAIFTKDVNARIAKFLDEPFNRAALGFLRIESISGTVVKLQTVAFRERPPYPQKDLFVSIDEEGGITFIR